MYSLGYLKRMNLQQEYDFTSKDKGEFIRLYFNYVKICIHRGQKDILSYSDFYIYFSIFFESNKGVQENIYNFLTFYTNPVNKNFVKDIGIFNVYHLKKMQRIFKSGIFHVTTESKVYDFVKEEIIRRYQIRADKFIAEFAQILC